MKKFTIEIKVVNTSFDDKWMCPQVAGWQLLCWEIGRFQEYMRGSDYPLDSHIIIHPHINSMRIQLPVLIPINIHLIQKSG